MKPVLRTPPALLMLLALALLLAILRTATHAAAPDVAASWIYLPLTACPTCQESIVTPAPTPTAAPATDAAEVLRLVNIERASVGCPAAVAEANLMAATQGWAEYQQTHNDYKHATADWYAPYGYPSGVLENIGGGSTPLLTVEYWMASSAHRANLLWCYPADDPSYDPGDVYVVGVGHASTYWVWGLTLKPR